MSDLKLSWIALLVAGLAGCGGGGSDSGTGPDHRATARVDQSHVDVAGQHGAPAPVGHITLTVDNPPAAGLYVVIEYSDDGVADIDLLVLTDTTANVEIRFRSPGDLPPGTYDDTIWIYLCYDEPCARQVTGSPLRLTTAYLVKSPDPDPDPGAPALTVIGRTELPHDVVDAEYSAALDAIVMVSAHPENALHVYFPATGARQEIALNKAPTSVSVSPDGLSAAVGHDALVTYVQLAELGTPAATAQVLLNVSARVGDLMLDGRGYVHAIPDSNRWELIRSVEIATNEERLGPYGPNGGSRGKLHPSGDFLYVASRGLSPNIVEKYGIQSGVALPMYRSPYHGQFEICSDLWIRQNGLHIYTACGYAFHASTDQSLDMTYAGSLSLSFEKYAGVIRSLSQSDAANEILLLEEHSDACSPHRDPAYCYTRLGIYESEFLNRLALFSVPRAVVDGQSYAQRGLFVFHSANGAHRYLISRLVGDPIERHYVNVLQ